MPLGSSNTASAGPTDAQAGCPSHRPTHGPESSGASKPAGGTQRLLATSTGSLASQSRSFTTTCGSRCLLHGDQVRADHTTALSRSRPNSKGPSHLTRERRRSQQQLMDRPSYVSGSSPFAPKSSTMHKRMTPPSVRMCCQSVAEILESEKGRGNLGGYGAQRFLGEATEHQVNHGNLNHCLAGFVPVFIVLAQASIIRQP